MRIVTAQEAVAGIRSGDQVYLQGTAATPEILLEALVDRASELEDVRIVHLHAEGPGPHLRPEMAGHFLHRALFIGPNARAAINEGRAESVPVFLSDVPRLMRRGILRFDAALVNLSPPDPHGYCSLGTSVDVNHDAIAAARVVIAQLNRSVPRTLGDSFVHVSDIDLAVEVDMPLYEFRVPPPGDIELRIAEFVADLVPDGSTLQMGIGDIPTAVGHALRDKRDLGIHSEMMTDPLVDLVEAGAVTGRLKELDARRIVTAFFLGTQRLYDFARDNPLVQMRRVDYTNDTATIRRFRKMCAINSAIEVDLTGQVCADSIGYRMFSGVGGQMDFIRGAALAEQGQAIIALPSTAKDGTISRITTHLKEGAGVVTTRAHVQTIVTEWGVAQLYGKSIPERARALIQIAHPAFRDDLEAFAHDHWHA